MIAMIKAKTLILFTQIPILKFHHITDWGATSSAGALQTISRSSLIKIILKNYLFVK